jgi:hypothetical protein
LLHELNIPTSKTKRLKHFIFASVLVHRGIGPSRPSVDQNWAEGKAYPRTKKKLEFELEIKTNDGTNTWRSTGTEGWIGKRLKKERRDKWKEPRMTNLSREL